MWFPVTHHVFTFCDISTVQVWVMTPFLCAKTLWRRKQVIISKKKKVSKRKFFYHPRPLSLSNREQNYSRGCCGLFSGWWAGSAGGVWRVQVTGPLSLRPDCALPHSYLCLCASDQRCADIYCTRPFVSFWEGFPQSLVPVTWKLRAHLKQFR